MCIRDRVIGLWTAVMSYGILKVLSYFVPIRVSLDEENEGLDINEHNEQGYSL